LSGAVHVIISLRHRFPRLMPKYQRCRSHEL
jgi:hypothetical protein